MIYIYSKEELKEMDKDIKVKKFLKLIYRDFDEDEEYIRIFQNNNDNNCKEKYFNDIDSVVNYVTGKNKYNKNTYLSINTTDGTGGKTENLKNSYCLFFDFDKKELGEDFDHIDVLNRFKQLKIHYHALVYTGHGFHAYICINKTNDIEKVNAVQKILCEKLGADINATKTTQLGRIPYTYNVKDSNKIELVKIVAMDDRNEINPYDIDFLYQKNCTIKNLNNLEKDKKNIRYLYKTTNIPPCIQKILNNGSPEDEHHREMDLCKIVVNLRQANKSLNEILTICREWNNKTNFNDSLEYRVKWIYNNLKYNTGMQCKECEHRNKCFNYTESEFDFDSLKDEDGKPYDTYFLEEKIIKKIKNKKNGTDNMLNGNEILILNVLKHEIDSPRPLTSKNNYAMDFKLLTRSITCKNKSCLSEKTLRETLKSLIDKKFVIEDTGFRNKKYYRFNPIKTTIDKTIEVSFMATVMCINRNITTDELALYFVIRRLHDIQLKEHKTTGNIFILSQSEIAKAYYKNKSTENQANISRMIKNLIDCRLMDIYDIKTSRINSFDYYCYKLNA